MKRGNENAYKKYSKNLKNGTEEMGKLSSPGLQILFDSYCTYAVSKVSFLVINVDF